jgi:Ca2+-binding RTX toxin-like protein
MIVYGTIHDDKIRGTSFNDILYGGRGADTIAAFGGDDVIFGGRGNDIIQDEGGSDTLFGGAGSDTFMFVGTTNSDALIKDHIADYQRGIDEIHLHFFNLDQWQVDVRFRKIVIDFDRDGAAEMIITTSSRIDPDDVFL